MKLKIENFGPIKKGEIDLSKRFYLLVGYNNTGKTYLSKLLFHVFNQDTIQKFSHSNYCKEIEKDIDISIDKNSFPFDNALLDKILIQFSLFLKDVILASFNVEKEHFAFDNFSIDFEYEWNEDVFESDKKHVSVLFSKEGNDIQYLWKKENTAEITYNIDRNNDAILGLDINNIFFKFDDELIRQKNTGKIQKENFIELLLRTLFNNQNEPFFLPANRVYLLENYEYIFRREKEKREEISKFFVKMRSNSITKEEQSELDRLMKNNYTEPVNSLIDEIYKISETKQEKQIYYRNILEKMAALMGGKIVTNKERFNGNDKYYFQVKNKRKQANLPFYLASSSVNQLSILYLYFEYFVKEKNNFLILDEPEENLHPETQILLMNLLFEFANMNGNKVLMTTHSPLLADVVNNYYYLAYLKQEKIEIPKGIEKYPFDTAIDFLPKDLGVYFFGKGKMQEYVFDKYGASFFDFDKEIRKIKDMGKLLTDAIFQHENQEE